MTKSLESSIVRIYDPTCNNVVGAGFFSKTGLVLTCAHVVEAALGIGHSVEIPNGTVQLDFPLVAPGQRLTARIVFWNPVNPNVFGEDIAGLKLETPLPDAAQPARLVSSKNLSNHPFSVFGFPHGREDGAWAYGKIKDITANGWL
ncbi:MAG: serine protease, partial [Dolichospermum sp.]